MRGVLRSLPDEPPRLVRMTAGSSRSVAPSSPPERRPPAAGAPGTAPPDPVRYLAQVMDEIDAEVRRRRASGDLPVGLEQELDELFLEFSPIGLHGKARLRETLSLVDRSAYVDL